MTASRAKIAAFGLVLLLPLTAEAESMPKLQRVPNPPSVQVVEGERDASFLPPETPSPAAPTVPSAAGGPAPVLAPSASVVVPPTSPLPPVAVPALAPTNTNPGGGVPVPPTGRVTTAPLPPVIMPVVAPPPAVPPPPAPPAVPAPTETAKVEEVDVPEPKIVDGLGALIWKGTSHTVPEKLLPTLSLPTSSAALNNLAQRFLLTTSAVPDGDPAGGISLVPARVEKLLALGDAASAWHMALTSKPSPVDEDLLRRVSEAALVSSDKDEVCKQLPEMVKARSSGDWQKLLLVCQLRANDTKGAQLTLDVLHAQNVKDETYFSLVEKNILTSGKKQLPRQLTPLKPLTLALLQQANLPLPGEVYARPDVALVPLLLKLPAKDDGVRLALAERTAETGLLSSADLAAVYKSVAFPADTLATAFSTLETGPRLHALLYQSTMAEKTPQVHVNYAVKFLQNSSAALQNGSGAAVMAEMVGAEKASEDFSTSAASIAKIYILAGKPEAALDWIKLAKRVAATSPAVTEELQAMWPLSVLGGIESDSDYGQNFPKWLEATLKSATPENRAPREQAAAILLLFDAAGFAVPDDAWGKVADVQVFEKRAAAPALTLQRLRAAAAAKKKGEAILFSLLAYGGDTSLFTTLEVVRALRQVELNADALTLARAAANSVLNPPPPKP